MNTQTFIPRITCPRTMAGRLRTACTTTLLPLLLLLALPVSVQAQFYYTTNNGAITITRYAGPGGAVTIPDTINGLPVTTIGQYFDAYNGGWLGAFQGCSGLTSVTISTNVTTIGEEAFCNCSGLSSITLSNNVVEIGGGAFQQCTGLTNVTILHCVTSIGQYAFIECASLTSVTISNSVASIGFGAFAQCPWLSEVTIGNGVTSIGGNAFAECISLTNVLIPSSVTNIEDGAFVDCTSLNAITVDAVNPTYSSGDGVLFNKSQTMLIACPEGKAGSYTIPTGVTSIGDGAFASCTTLASVTIPNSVTSIGTAAFSFCTNLTSVTIPSSVTNIGQDAFYRCTLLTSITIPGSITSIASATFEQCGSLSNVTIGNGVTSIGDYAFCLCASLTSLTIPDSVTNIGEGAFDLCTGLTSITVPNSVTSIGNYAFDTCTNLTSITIPGSIASIGDYAFSYCSSLTALYFQGNAPSLGLSVFYADNDATVYCLPGTTGWDTTYGGRPTAVWWIPPTIQGSPPSRTAEAGATVDLRVEATCPLYYLWYLYHTNLISCSTNCDLELTNVQFSQSGTYTVVVSNVLGAVTSAPAMLNVIAPVERRPVPGIKVTGQSGNVLYLDYADFLKPAPNWTTLGSISLTSTSQYYFDLTLSLAPQRFYRASQTGTPGVMPSLDLHLVPALTLTGNIGGSVRVDYINRVGPTDAWVTLDTVSLTNTSQLYFDTSSIGQPARLYRLVPSP